MSWTKRQLVEEAFDLIGLSSYTFDLQPEQYQSALRKLDAMMAQWLSRGLNLGYALSGSPSESDLDSDSGVPVLAVSAIYHNLALQLATAFGKQPSNTLLKDARMGLSDLYRHTSVIRERQLPNTVPLGAGNKGWRYRDVFVSEPNTDPLQIDSGGQLEFLDN